MKKLLITLCILAPVFFMTSCSVATGFGYAAPVYNPSPAWGYANYGYGSTWYGGTPDYYDTNLYVDTW